MVDILVFGAHPDDIEFGCGGILAKLAAEGKSIVMADLTIGEKGTRGTPEIRRKECENSAAVIGAKRICLNFKDCEVFDTYGGRLKLVAAIREHKPRLVLAPTWQGVGDHPDHFACGLMARHACRFARFSKILPELPTHWVEGILHYLSTTYDKPDFLIDITKHVEPWKRMMSCHATQLEGYKYNDWSLRQASELGIHIDVPYAQGLIKSNPIVIDDLFTISKATREL